MMGAGRHAAAGLAAVIALGVAPASAVAAWPVYGHDLRNSRSAGAAGPSRDAAPGLKPEWTFRSPTGDFTGTPVVAGGVLVAGNYGGTVYGLDAATGRVLWSRQLGDPINGSAAIALHAPGGPLAFVPVARPGSPYLEAFSLRTGSPRWRTVLTRQPTSSVFGSPTRWHHLVYMGTSGPNGDQSTARGSVVAVTERTGRVRWRRFTVPPGFDGGSVWSTPAIDRSTARLYVGTGNAYDKPAAPTTDSILALDAHSGRIVRHFQATSGDIFNGGQNIGPDADFGASPNLTTSRNGHLRVGEGAKSGTYWTLRRRTLKPVWHATVGPGSAIGGILGSTAYDGSRIYGTDAANGAVWALGPDGAGQWTSNDAATLDFSPVAVANGVLYSATPSGFLVARDSTSGDVLARLSLGAPTLGGISITGTAVYVAVGTGPPPAPAPQVDGPGSIVAFKSASGSSR